MTVTITLADARAMVDKAIEQRGTEFIYGDEFDFDAGCRYFAYNESGELMPACIVGLGFALHYPELAKWLQDGGFDNSVFKEIANVAAAAGVFIVSDDAETYLAQAQETQDHNKTWGQAKKDADRRFASLNKEVAS